MSQGMYSQDDKDISAQPGEQAGESLTDFGMGDNSVTTPGDNGATRRRSSRARRDEDGAQTRRRKSDSTADSLHEGRDAPEIPEIPEIIELPLRQGINSSKSEPSEEAASDAMLGELEAQGFTEDEAYHLIDVSDRIANSRETREAEAIIRRLRFNRWLFEQGKLSEFSA